MNTKGNNLIERVTKLINNQHLTFSFTIFYFIEEEEGLRRSVASV